MNETGSRPQSLLDGSVVHRDPEIHSGEAVFVGTRVPVQTFIEYLEGGTTWTNSWITSPASAVSRRSRFSSRRPKRSC
jgi:hypothetical protein